MRSHINVVFGVDHGIYQALINNVYRG